MIVSVYFQGDLYGEVLFREDGTRAYRGPRSDIVQQVVRSIASRYDKLTPQGLVDALHGHWAGVLKQQ